MKSSRGLIFPLFVGFAFVVFAAPAFGQVTTGLPLICPLFPRTGSYDILLEFLRS